MVGRQGLEESMKTSEHRRASKRSGLTATALFFVLSLLASASGPSLQAQEVQPVQEVQENQAVQESKPVQQNWPGWRGLTADGSLPHAAAPSGWTEDDARWTLEVPGDGYSSPIVYGDTVFLTTAYETARGEAAIQVFRWLLFGLGLAALVLADRFVVARCAAPGQSFLDRLALIVFGGVSIALAGFVLFGENVLSYSGTRDVRSWLSSGLGATLCLLFIAFFASAAWRRRYVPSLLMVIFSVVFLAITPMPTREFLFDGSLLRPPLTADAVVVFALPVFLLVAAVALVVLGRLVPSVFGAESFGVEPVADPSSKLEGPGLRSLILVKTVPVLLVVAGWILLQRVVASSEYLAHHIGERMGSEPVLGWLSVGLFVGVYLGFLTNRIAGRRLPAWEARVFPWLLLLLVVVIVFGANFLSTTTELTRAVVAVDGQDGEIRWIREGLDSPAGARNTFNSPATPTPMTDGRRVYAYFGSAGLLATDLDGRLLWESRGYAYDNVYGTVVSPVVVDDVLVLVMDTPEDPYIVGLDAATGEEIWRRDRDPEGFSFNGVSRTPLVRDVDGRPVVFVWGSVDLKAYDLHTGEELGRIELRLGGSDRVASPIADGERLYLIGQKKAIAVDMAHFLGKSDLGKSVLGIDGAEGALVWQSDEISGPNCSSPVLAGGLIFAISDWGKAIALDAATGEPLWEKKLDGEFYASLVALGDQVVAVTTAGELTVFAAERAYRELRKEQLPDKVFASFAAVPDTVFVRTERLLLAFES